MRFPYQESPVGSVAGFQSGKLFQPKVWIVLMGPKGEYRLKAVVDTGSDQTILPILDTEELTGIHIDRKTKASVRGISRHPAELFLSRNCQLLLSDDKESLRWPAIVWFSSDKSTPPILGHSGFLEYFTATFDGFKKQLELLPNKSFPGEIKTIAW